jgi:hypothetical protein
MLTVWLDHETEEGEPVQIQVAANVVEMRDPYGTGDSPAEFEINVAAATDANGRAYELSGFMLRQAETKLIEAYRGF